MDGEDWDLAAIVRSCCCSKRKQQQSEEIAAAAASDSHPSVEIQIGDQVKREKNFFGFSGRKLERKPSFVDEGLQVLCNPSLLKSVAFKNRTERAATSASQSSSRTKRRKNQLKKVVCQVPADGVSSDVWNWRKYGQKPIKGSPYPRGYYKCSTIRGCPARKQVERDRTNPRQLIITYTSEHNHPMPAHHKLPSSDKIPTSPATSMSMNNEDQEKEEEEEEEEEMLMVEDMEVIGEDELIFVGNNSTESLFDDDDGGGVFDDRSFAWPWFEKSNATAAAC